MRGKNSRIAKNSRNPCIFLKAVIALEELYFNSLSAASNLSRDEKETTPIISHSICRYSESTSAMEHVGLQSVRRSQHQPMRDQ